MNILKSLILIFSFFYLTNASAQPVGKKYTFKEIGWTITLSGDFTAFPSADQSVHIQQNQKPNDQSSSKRLILAMKDANTFSVNLSSCDIHDKHAGDIFSESNKHSYSVASQAEGTQCDTVTTTVSIDGVAFRNFRMITKKNSQIRESYESLYTCYNGYAIYITLAYFSKKTGEELKSMLEQSKFSR